MDFGAAVLFALFAWWFGTGAVLYLDRPTPSRRGPATFYLTFMVGIAGVVGIITTAEYASEWGAYLSFVSALVVWGSHELSFLTGWITGPRRVPCPPGVEGWRRFALATEVVIHHEIALAVTLLLVFVGTWSAPNQVGTGTFIVLWVMRVSAKLNIFLGVRNLTEEFIPAHLGYMKSYFRRRNYNPLMPISVTAAVGTACLTVQGGLSSAANEEMVAAGLIATLLALAALEHVLLMLPVPDQLLWKWALRGSSAES